MIKQCFTKQFQTFSIASLVHSKSLPINVKSSIKYKQILTSISEIGLIEPVIIFIADDDSKRILDGHLRIEALKDLDIKFVHCLISAVEDTYSYNKRVNRLTIIQEQKMLQKAIESGVSIDRLSAVLGTSSITLNSKLRISDGIAKEVIALLAEKNVSQSIFRILRKIKPYKQIEMVTTMISINNFTQKFALSMLHAIAPEHLINQSNKESDNKDIGKTLARLEKEMAAIQIETQNIQDEYAENNLKMVIIRSHIVKLLSNNEVLHWLYDNKNEYLTILKKVSGMDNLNNIQMANERHGE
ncbi:RepB plasmid partitioning protein [Yersinia intermedia]|uniref:plasmid partitioning protein RepB C-terminal domain-containing protein n=1 Tax=Yersinia intermedia TaxID=631 RepID=UPI0005EA3D67|nr:plasmid partitioning protein RepB C-terminal domain-containing protein [Yersinia intermedia]CNI33466.1 RepB plasmid partitioning protein [Yersinia intermedia]CQD84601.1 RepB plasmid partitioning protein [Yersinia intermedia]